MSLFGRKKKAQNGDTGVRTKDFFDCILPGTMKFFANYYIVGDTYRCVREKLVGEKFREGRMEVAFELWIEQV